MRQIQRSDIKGPAIYNGMRDDFRKRIIEVKRDRRVLIGDRVSLVFENRTTLISQIQEMLRVENLTTDSQIQAEIDVYNAIMPTDTSLSATLFLEVPVGTNPRIELDRLIGLDEHLILHIGEHALRADFEPGRGTTDRISAVQYVRFPLSAEALKALQTSNTSVKMEIDHPGYQHTSEASEPLRAALAADFDEGQSTL